MLCPQMFSTNLCEAWQLGTTHGYGQRLGPTDKEGFYKNTMVTEIGEILTSLPRILTWSLSSKIALKISRTLRTLQSETSLDLLDLSGWTLTYNMNFLFVNRGEDPGVCWPPSIGSGAVWMCPANSILEPNASESPIVQERRSNIFTQLPDSRLILLDFAGSDRTHSAKLSNPLIKWMVKRLCHLFGKPQCAICAHGGSQKNEFWSRQSSTYRKIKIEASCWRPK